MKLKDRILKELQRFVNRLLKAKGYEYTPEVSQDPGDPPGAQETAIPEASQTQKPQKEIKLHSFGSPNVGKCRESNDAQIKDFKMDKKGMSYKWAKGGCESLGAKDKSDAGATLAVCGYSNNGIDYHVTKFDWISTSRTTRSWENVKEHYNGINPDTFFEAPYHCFFICDKHGNYRTNVLTDK